MLIRPMRMVCLSSILLADFILALLRRKVWIHIEQILRMNEILNFEFCARLCRLPEQELCALRILTLLMRLRQICCHPTLFDENYDKDSGKLDLLMELVTNAVESGHRILVFSQFTSMLSIIRESLKNVGIDSFYLDGNSAITTRFFLQKAPRSSFPS